MSVEHIITISNAEWGYLLELGDFSGGRIKKTKQTKDGRHQLRSLGDNAVQVGVPAVDYSPTLYGYGCVRPWSDEGVTKAEAALQKEWQEHKGQGQVLDYYAAQKFGTPDPDSIGLIYPERVFVNGVDVESGDLERNVLMKHLKAVGVQHHFSVWGPLQLYGSIAAGLPEFQPSLIAHTDIGVSWYEVRDKLKRKLPSGYSWEYFPSAMYGTLYYEGEEIK